MKKVKISDIVEVFNGYAFDSDSFNSDGKGLPIIRIRDVVPGYSETYYSGDYPKEYLLDNGALLVGMDGEFNIEFWKGGKALLNQRVCQIIPKDSADILFLKYRLSLLLKRIEDETPFVTVKHLSSEKLKDEEIELPPLTEQKRIASLLARADRLHTLRRTAHDLGESLLQSVFLEMFGDVVRNDKGWEKVSISDLGKVQTGNTPSREEPENYGDFIEWIKSDNIRDEQLYVSPSREKLSEIGLKKGRSVNAGSVLVTCIAGSLEHIGDTSLTDRTVAFNQQINSISPSDDVNPLFLRTMMHIAKPYIQFNASDGMKHIITKSKLEELVLVKPPLSLQEEFAGVVARVESMRGRMSEAGRQVEGLFESLLAEAFQ